MVKALSSEMMPPIQERAAQVNMDEGVFGTIPFFTSHKSRNNEEIQEKSEEFDMSHPGGDGKKRTP